MRQIIQKTLLVVAAGALSATSALAADQPGSAFVRCDGKPNKPSELGTIARLIAITAIVGLLIPERESADPSKRQKGIDGVRACDEALNGAEKASDGGRRIELMLGRSIHQMEQSNWDAALDDIHAVPNDQPDLVATRVYKESLGLTALNLEAMALVGKGEFHEARLTAQKMALQAPYNIKNVLRAIDYMRLDQSWDEGKDRFFDQLVKMYSAGLNDRASQRSAAGMFDRAGQDYMATVELARGIEGWHDYGNLARAAVAFHLAGDKEKARSLLTEARASANKDRASAGNDEFQATVSEAEDFFAIIGRLDAGDTRVARTMFAARSEWRELPAAFPAELSNKLEAVSEEGQRAEIQIKSADAIMKESQQWSINLINDAGPDSRDRWAMFGSVFSDGDFNKFSRNVWSTDKSKYFAKKPDEKWKATFVDTLRSGDGMPAAYAFYLHNALMAKAQGKKGFMVLPGQRAVFAGFVRLGNPGDEGIVSDSLFDADKVIEDLEPYIPRPVDNRSREVIR